MIARPFFALLAFLGLGLFSAFAESQTEQLFAQAREEAPGELQLHIIKTKGRLSNFITKVRVVEQVPGWPQIRVSGDAAYAAWDNLRKDYVWDGGKFEVLFNIVDGKRIELNSVTFAGRTSQPES